MPLIKSKSKAAFGKNVAAEIKAGKPQKQAVAIAYSEKRMAKKSVGGNLKEVSADNKGLPKLPTEVRHKMGYMKDGGKPPGLYANIHRKQERIKREKAEGLPVEHMRKVGSKGAPTKDAFVQSAKTAKKKVGGCVW